MKKFKIKFQEKPGGRLKHEKITRTIEIKARSKIDVFGIVQKLYGNKKNTKLKIVDIEEINDV